MIIHNMCVDENDLAADFPDRNPVDEPVFNTDEFICPVDDDAHRIRTFLSTFAAANWKIVGGHAVRR